MYTETITKSCPDCWIDHEFEYKLTIDCDIDVKPFKCSCGYEFTENELVDSVKKHHQDITLAREIENQEHDKAMGYIL